MPTQDVPNGNEGQQPNLHGNLLLQAKHNQKRHLQESSHLSQQLHRTLASLIRSNSNNGNECPPVLDKITTIHQLDQEIDRQLKEDVSVNYEALLHDKRNLTNLINKSNSKLQLHTYDGTNKQTSSVDEFQRRSELIDQDLRILEYTLKLIKLNKDPTK
ncbi:uncharacterized protein AC631_01947 [Debaryomyces fabryi]|uniref:Uncharacterized protein n=1 Tax=Debaryomyces fabryi TaxID=58627 RepID=A0A0V1Q1F4_9ASCO|nr:uncharacterized protein AC631_01947 [Debaryomyces fabryi]KSA02297.1 hypothetical protein AC631_01947 [Debaryomyces fabryi]CUM47257.1 unnamed protein product [Debaryomyces fabryi]